MLQLQRFAMNSNTLAGTLEEKLRAVKAAGFGAMVLSGGDLVGHRRARQEGRDLARRADRRHEALKDSHSMSNTTEEK
ncbi:MAG TPA: hypothetical protein VMM27_06520 [Casimicrobiaceae bacterium]|nr:hypothetical protein [Casimicrobiaceae bacterium]